MTRKEEILKAARAYPRLQDVGNLTATRIGFYIDKIRKNI